MSATGRRRTITAVLRHNPQLVPAIARRLIRRVDDDSVALVAEAARSLEPVLEQVVERRPSKFAEWGLKGARGFGRLTEVGGPLDGVIRSGDVAIMFVDIVDFTAFTARHGDEAAIALVAEVTRVSKRAVAVGKGATVKRLGDGFLLAFPSASQGTRAAVAMRDGADRIRLRGIENAPRLRIAMHLGHPHFEDDDIFGYDVNLTAQLLEHCEPDDVLLTEAAKQKAERRLKSVHFGEPRSVDIHKAGANLTAYPVLRPKSTPNRGSIERDERA